MLWNGEHKNAVNHSQALLDRQTITYLTKKEKRKKRGLTEVQNATGEEELEVEYRH